MPKKTAKKTIAHKGKPTRLTVAKRRAILIQHGWVQTPPHPHVFWRGTPSMQRVRINTGEVSDNGGETYTNLTDRDFRAFARKYAPIAKKPRMTLASVRKLAVDGINDALKAIRDTDRKAASRILNLEMAVMGRSDAEPDVVLADCITAMVTAQGKRLDAVESALPQAVKRAALQAAFDKRQASPAPDVAALCKRHGLKLSEGGGIYSVEIGPSYLGVHGPKTTSEKQPPGSWFWYPNGFGHQYTDSGSIDTLAAALERYCPMADEPMVVHVSETDSTPRPEQVAAMKRHMENGGVILVESTSPYGEAERRAHLRKYAVKRNGPASLDLSQSKAWREAEAAVADKVAAIRRMNPPSGLVMEAPPRDPDATPDERRAELERRGLKQSCGHPSRYELDGEIYPCGYVSGGVFDGASMRTKTRTLAEFCAALDAVGLVAKPATPAERAALCEKWGFTKFPAESGRGSCWYADMKGGDWFSLYTVTGGWDINHPGSDLAATVIGTTTTLVDLEAVFRERLPYTREWREKVLREKGWVEVPDSYEWIPRCDHPAVYTPGPRCNPTMQFTWPTGKGTAVEAPDRAAWLAFIREHTPKAAPVDAPHFAQLAKALARIAELEAQLAAVKKALGEGGAA